MSSCIWTLAALMTGGKRTEEARVFQWAAYRWRSRRWGRDFVGRSCAKLAWDYLYAPKGAELQHFPLQWRRKLEEQLRRTILEDIPTAQNPIIRLRELIAAEALAYAGLAVLTLTLEEKLAFAPWATANGISGELHHHIKACARHQSDLAAYLERFPDADHKLLDRYARSNKAIHSYRLNSFHVVRVHLDDVIPPPDRDWLAPLVASMMVHAEATYRLKLGLPAMTENLSHGTEHLEFASFVLKGEIDPVTAWESHYGRRHNDDV